MPLAKQGLLVAMAHITGGGLLENIPRFLSDDLAVQLDATTWPLLPVFKWLQQMGRMSDGPRPRRRTRPPGKAPLTPRDAVELARTFNCGIGMTMVVKPGCVGAVAAYLQEHQQPFHVIGQVVRRPSPAAAQVHIVKTEQAWH